MGWGRMKNGELLDAAQAAGFDVLITADQNLRYQQNLSARKIAIIELPTNRLRLVVNYTAPVNALIASITPSTYHTVTLVPDA